MNELCDWRDLKLVMCGTRFTDLGKAVIHLISRSTNSFVLRAIKQ